MPDETRHESEDLQDSQVQDSTDTLSGAPGDDPLDRGVVPPERWSAGVRFGDTANEQSEGESLDQLLSEEEPDPVLDFDEDDDEDEDLEDVEDDDEAGDEDVDGLLLDDGPDPRAGRLVAEDEGAHPVMTSRTSGNSTGRPGGKRATKRRCRGVSTARAA